MTALNVGEAIEAAQDAEPSMPDKCEVQFVIQLAKRIRWPRLTWRCKQPGVWCAINLCCGSRSVACNKHKETADWIEARKPKSAHMRCGECGQDVRFVWSRIR